jgi:hypothetical protein
VTPSLFIATPLHDARMGLRYTHGLLQAWGCGLAQHWSALNGTGLMRQRDALVVEFAKSSCTHLLFVDSDMGWHPDDARKLLATGKDFIGGSYIRKGPGNVLTANLLPVRDGELYQATHVGTGFLLVSRDAISKMLTAYEELRYESAGQSRIALFLQNKNEGTEDLSFCRRWRELGGDVWMHTGVVLAHFDGNTAYVADMTELRTHLAAEQIVVGAAAAE